MKATGSLTKDCQDNLLLIFNNNLKIEYESNYKSEKGTFSSLVVQVFFASSTRVASVPLLKYFITVKSIHDQRTNPAFLPEMEI
jgi:hypothetical protein